jgi:hypothetical protein
MTPTDRILAGLAAAYFAYRLWSGWGEGIIFGDGDEDVRADEHPTAFVLTALSVILLIAMLGCIALGYRSRPTVWARKFFRRVIGPASPTARLSRMKRNPRQGTASGVV